MTIGILITTSPEHQNGYTVFRLAEAFLANGGAVEIFLMDDGIYNIVKNPAKERLFSGFERLISLGAKVLICALSAESRGLTEQDLLPGVGAMSQYELSDIVSRSDRFLYFGA
jgi:sulfur relay (sulfurtransferase) complex TusBCD TusD component (DsrE family)